MKTHPHLSSRATGKHAHWATKPPLFAMMIDSVALFMALILVDEEQRFPVVAANGIALSQSPKVDLIGLGSFEFMEKELHSEAREVFTLLRHQRTP
jgi:hypothetical protein